MCYSLRLSLNFTSLQKHTLRSSFVKKKVRSVCQAKGEENDKEELSKIPGLKGLEKTVEKMLLESEAVKSAIDRVSSASERFEEALREKAELEQRAALTQQQKDEIEELSTHHLVAKAEVEAARKKLRAAELRKLTISDEQHALQELARKNEDRLESVKALTVSSLTGIAALFPVLLVQADNLERDILRLAATAVCAGLFGVTYRYAVGDGKDVQLKLGVVSAFWIVSSLSFAQSAWHSISDPISHFDIHLWNKIGIYSVQTLIIFLTATLALEFSFRSGFIKHAVSSSAN